MQPCHTKGPCEAPGPGWAASENQNPSRGAVRSDVRSVLPVLLKPHETRPRSNPAGPLGNSSGWGSAERGAATAQRSAGRLYEYSSQGQPAPPPSPQAPGDRRTVPAARARCEGLHHLQVQSDVLVGRRVHHVHPARPLHGADSGRTATDAARRTGADRLGKWVGAHGGGADRAGRPAVAVTLASPAAT